MWYSLIRNDLSLECAYRRKKIESQIQISYGSVYRMRTDSHCGAQHKWLCAVRL